MLNRSIMQSWRGLGFSTYWLITGIACVALALTLVSVVVVVNTHRDARSQAEASAQNLVSAMVRGIDRDLDAVDHSLQTVARRLQTDGMGVLLEPWVGNLFNRAIESGRLSAIMVLDAEGRLLVDSGSSAGHVAFTDTELYLTHIQPGDQGFFVGEPLQAAIGERDYFYVSREVNRADGTLAAIVVGEIELDDLLGQFRQMLLGPNGVVTLLRADGILIARNPMPSERVAPDVLRQGQLLQNFARAPEGSYQSASLIDGVSRLHVYSAIGNHPLLLLVGQETQYVYAGWRDKAWLMGLLALMMNVALVALAVLLRRDIIRHRRAHAVTERNEALFRGAMQGAGIGTALTDADRRILHVNPALCRMFGYPAEEFVGRRVSDFSHPGERPPNLAALPALFKGEIEFHEAERRYMRKDGSVFWGLSSFSVDRTAPSAPVMIIQIQDITARKEAEQARDILLDQLHNTTVALDGEKELLRVTLGALSESVITADGEGRIKFMNLSAEATTGWTLAEVNGKPLIDVVPLYDLEADLPFTHFVERLLSTGQRFHENLALRGRDGERREIEARAAPLEALNGNARGMVLAYQDVTTARALQRELRHYASHDALTGLPNRSAFQSRIEAKLREARERGSCHALVFIDLDRFKIINDTAGHIAGDALLRQVAATLLSQLRPEDMLARLGGDEFGVILADCGLNEAEPVVERLLAALARQFPWEGRNYDVGASAGVAEIAPNSASSSEVLGQADVACFAAKSAGRNRISLYQSGQSDAVERHRELAVAADLRQALNDDRFVLYGQRVVSTSDPAHVRYEVLLRMLAPDGSPVAPGAFIPAAEQYDMMAEIDRWVLDTALRRFGSRIASIPGLHLHINLSANSLNDPTFLEYILVLIQESPISVEKLTFEITETALVSNMSHATGVISALRHVGCQVALDDFGIGLSSFSYLRTFPVDLVKIDGSFICNMAHSAVDCSIAGSIHQIAKVLGAQTIAEAVEDDATFEVVQKLEIDFAQGYGLHYPERLEDILTRYGA